MAGERGDRPTYTLEQLRAWCDRRAWQLEGNRKRRGYWADEQLEHEVMDALTGLIDRIGGDREILERLKGKGKT